MLSDYSIFSEELVHALGWTMIHSLWQAALIGFVLLISLRSLKHQSALLRYCLALSALGTIFLVSSITFLNLYDFSNNTVTVFFDSPESVFPQIENPSNHFDTLSKEIGFWRISVEQYFPTLALLWFFGVLFFFARFSFGLFQIHQLRQYGYYAISAAWEERFTALAETFNLPVKVALLESVLTKVPLTIGYLKPLILLPIGTLNMLSPAEVEAVLAHELAHIARRDYLINLLQSFIEILFFFHPMVWWISLQIRIEREHCCDDLALQTGTDRLVYAKALLRLKELQTQAPRLALSFGGNQKYLLNRIQRILNQSQHKSTIMEKFVVTCLLLISLFFLSIQKHQAAESTFSESTAVTNPLDSLPSSNLDRISITTYENGRRIEAKWENDKIQSLKIDGKKIPPQEFSQHEALIKKLIEDVPAPPVPPSPPMPPAAPPSPPVPPAPPTPPAPPALGSGEKYGTKAYEEGLKTYAEQLELSRVEMEKITEGLEMVKNQSAEEAKLMERASLEAERAHREIEAAHQALEKEHQLIEKEHQEIQEKQADFLKDLRQSLLEDGMIEKVDDYILELNATKLKVNGKVQSARLFRKYKAILEQHKSSPLGTKDKVKIIIEPNFQSVHFDFAVGGGTFNNESPLPDRLLESLYTSEANWQEAQEDGLSVFFDKAFINEVGMELKKDGLIRNRKLFEFELNARTKALKIDGQLLAAKTQQKYEALLRNATNFELSWDFIYSFKRRGVLSDQVELSNYAVNKNRTYSTAPHAEPQYIFDNTSLLRQLNKSLKKDGLIQDTKSYKFTVNSNQLLINEEPQKAEMQWKYEDLIREAASVSLAESFNFTLDNNTNGAVNFILTDN